MLVLRRRTGEAPRFKPHTFGFLGARLVVAAVALIVGIAFTAFGAVGVATGHDTTVILICGVVMVAVGAGGIVLARWMARRGI
jgi:hypothetical protein